MYTCLGSPREEEPGGLLSRGSHKSTSTPSLNLAFQWTPISSAETLLFLEPNSAPTWDGNGQGSRPTFSLPWGSSLMLAWRWLEHNGESSASARAMLAKEVGTVGKALSQQPGLAASGSLQVWAAARQPGLAALGSLQVWAAARLPENCPNPRVIPSAHRGCCQPPCCLRSVSRLSLRKGASLLDQIQTWP